MAQDDLWYKDTIFYEVPIKSFVDSNGDGIGDIPGLIQKLDYLQDLGITTLWVLPFYPSPLKDDGYDISNYMDIHPQYGHLKDFKLLVREAHSRGIRVVIELVINHTSDQHPWFQRARKSPKNSPEWNYYVWSDTPDRYKEARIIFKDFEASNWTWDPVAKSYFWHRFYSHQPDLNFHSKEMKEELFHIIDFWLSLGVDGMRLDAIPYLYEKEGTNCENLPETHQFLRELREYIDKKFPNRMLLAEANQWPEDAAHYFGKGDECHMAFHFPVMPRLFMAIHLEDRFPITEISEQTPAIPDTCQWALFLRNHDELTLEMVTDEERDYMFRVYAHDPQSRVNLGIRRRLAPLMKNDRRKIELMNSLLFSLVGTPIIYYGDEIGMGDNIYLGDRNAVRTPMQWNNDRNAGFSRTNPQQLYLPVIIDPEYHYETINVEAQQSSPHSLYWWMKRIIALRKKHKSFGRGSTHFLNPDNHKILAFLREYEDETLLIIANLSRFVQYVRLDLSLFKGMYPLELFSQNTFPPIGDLPYFFTLGPHAFYWFKIEKEKKESHFVTTKGVDQQLPLIQLEENFTDLLSSGHRRSLEYVLVNYFSREKFKEGIDSIKVLDIYETKTNTRPIYLFIVRAALNAYDSIDYFLPIAMATDTSHQQELMERCPEKLIARMSISAGQSLAYLYEPIEDQDVLEMLIEFIQKNQTISDHNGTLKGHLPRADLPFSFQFETNVICATPSIRSFPLNGAILKVFQKMGDGIRIDLEVRQFLTNHTSFEKFTPLIGYLEYTRERGGSYTIAEILQMPSQTVLNAAELMLEKAEKFLEESLLDKEESETTYSIFHDPLPHSLEKEVPEHLLTKIGDQLELIKQVGELTSDLHFALSSEENIPAFSVDRFDSYYQRSIYQNLRSSLDRMRYILKAGVGPTPKIQQKCQNIVQSHAKILSYIGQLLNTRIHALRTRYHGEYTLEHLIYTGKEFLIYNFERPESEGYSEKRFKRSPLRDIASMMFSLVLTGYISLEKIKQKALITSQADEENLEKNVLQWSGWMGFSFLKAYFEQQSKMTFLPTDASELNFLMSVCLLDQILSSLTISYTKGDPLLFKVSVEVFDRWISVYISPSGTDETTTL